MIKFSAFKVSKHCYKATCSPMRDMCDMDLRILIYLFADKILLLSLVMR